MERMPASFTNDPIFRKLGKVARVGALTEAQRRAYDHSLKIYRDNYAIAQTERDLGRAEGISEGIAKGRAEGRAEGIAKGRAEGIAEGRAEGEAKKNLQVVKNLLDSGAEIEFIARICNLSVEDVRKIIETARK